MDLEIAEQLARRDRHVRYRWAATSWADRWDAMVRARSVARPMSPEGRAHFLRRNYRKRATDWVEPATGAD